MTQTIVQYLAKRLNDLGVDDIFGVPGDYNFHILEAIENHGKAKWIGSSYRASAF